MMLFQLHRSTARNYLEDVICSLLTGLVNLSAETEINQKWLRMATKSSDLRQM
jgi:hypothetical protein